MADKTFGSSAGLTILAEDQATPANGMVAHVTSSWNSGYQNGDIKGAFLSDTDDTDLVGSGELVTNGDFSSTDVSAWTGDAASTISAPSGELVLENGDSTAAYAGYTVSTVVGKTYTYKVDLVSKTGGNARILIVGEKDTGATLGVGTHSLTWVATSTTHTVVVSNGNNITLGGSSNWDNISVKLADEDRSVNSNGLVIEGTITRTFVDEV